MTSSVGSDRQQAGPAGQVAQQLGQVDARRGTSAGVPRSSDRHPVGRPALGRSVGSGRQPVGASVGSARGRRWSARRTRPIVGLGLVTLPGGSSPAPTTAAPDAVVRHVGQVDGRQRARAESGARSRGIVGAISSRSVPAHVGQVSCAASSMRIRVVTACTHSSCAVSGSLPSSSGQRRHRRGRERAQVGRPTRVVALLGVRRQQQVGRLGGLLGEVAEGVGDLGRVVLGASERARDLVEARGGTRQQRRALALSPKLMPAWALSMPRLSG